MYETARYKKQDHDQVKDHILKNKKAHTLGLEKPLQFGEFLNDFIILFFFIFLKNCWMVIDRLHVLKIRLSNNNRIITKL